MVSRENLVIVGFIALAVGCLFVVAETTKPPTWVGAAILIGVGVIAPTMLNAYLDRIGA